VCENCGTVVDDGVMVETIVKPDNYICDYGNPLLKNNTLGSKISGNWRIAKIHKYGSMSYEQLVLRKIYTMMNTLFGENITSVLIDDALCNFKLFNSAVKADGGHKIVRRDNRIGIVGVCIYYACIERGFNRTSKEIIGILNIDSKRFNRLTREYIEHTNMNIVKTCQSKDFLDRFYNKLGVNDFKIVSLTTRILESIEQLQLLYNTSSVCKAASIIYFVLTELDMDVKCKAIADVTSVSCVTIRKLYSIINKNKDIIFKTTKDNKDGVKR
jgi:transcription initiation factor TFIIIB Brf1 subunit/transcription initiation factor TFIIB